MVPILQCENQVKVNKKEKQDAQKASCSKDFRRLFNKKVFTDTAVINKTELHSDLFGTF
jgi:hypothetical protein